MRFVRRFIFENSWLLKPNLDTVVLIIGRKLAMIILFPNLRLLVLRILATGEETCGPNLKGILINVSRGLMCFVVFMILIPFLSLIC